MGSKERKPQQPQASRDGEVERPLTDEQVWELLREELDAWQEARDEALRLIEEAR